MALQGAYDRQRPNGSHRRPAGGREAIHVYRLYRRALPGADSFALLENDSLLGRARNAVRSARNSIASAQAWLTTTKDDVAGRILELELRVPLVVDSFEKTTDVRSAFTYTQGGHFIDTPFGNAKGVSRFAIRGRTYWTPVRVNGVEVDGDAAVKEFAELIDDYFFPRDGRQSAEYELYFIDLTAAISGEDPIGEQEWRIQPLQGLRLSQAAPRPFLRTWQFSFLGLESNRDRAKADDGFWQSLTSRSGLAALLDRLGLASVVESVTQVVGLVDDVNGLFDDLGNVVTASLDYVRGVESVITGGIGKVRGLLNRVDTLINRISDGVDYLKSLPSEIGEQFTLLARDFPGLADGDATKGTIAIDDLRRVQDFLLALNANPQAFAPAVSPEPATAAVAVRPGQTIEQIAAEQGIDAETLIALNGLQYPFVSPQPNAVRQADEASARRDSLRASRDAAQAARNAAEAAGGSPTDLAGIDREVARHAAAAASADAEVDTWSNASAPSPRVLYAGDFIKVPRPQRGAASVVEITPEMRSRVTALTGRAPDEEDRLFGFDLALEDGSLRWDDEKSDLVLERGTRNMAVTEVRYVRLPLGALRYAPNLGNFAFELLGNWAGPAGNQLLAAALYRTLAQDPRVRRVRNVTADTLAGVATLVFDAELTNGVVLPGLRAPVP